MSDEDEIERLRAENLRLRTAAESALLLAEALAMSWSGSTPAAGSEQAEAVVAALREALAEG